MRALRQSAIETIGLWWWIVLLVSLGGSVSIRAQDTSTSTQRGEPSRDTEPEPIAVVELFTSQGCSSCPPADRLLRMIVDRSAKNQQQVYCLSFHVDYWNDLGWSDPYSSKEFSRRQRAYAKAMKSDRVYTPQMIVNGTREFVGSRGNDAERALGQALSRDGTSTVVIDAQSIPDGQRATLKYEVSGHSKASVLNVAVVQTAAANEVPRGENAGSRLQHANVVRYFKTVPLNQGGRGNLEIELPKGLELLRATLIAYVQNRRDLTITGAAQVPWSDEKQ